MKRQRVNVQSKPSKQIKTEVVPDETKVKEDCLSQEHELSSSAVKLESPDNILEQVFSIIQSGTLAQLTDVLKFKPDLNVYVNGETALHHCISTGKFSHKPTSLV